MSSSTDRQDLFDHVWTRLADRLRGLTDDEWAWRPVPADPDISIRWRLDHIANTLSDPRNREWLGGRVASAARTIGVDSASFATAALGVAYANFRLVPDSAVAGSTEPRSLFSVISTRTRPFGEGASQLAVG